MVECNLQFIMQICSIIAGVICVVFSIIDLCCFWSILSLFSCIFGIILGATCILVEVYIFDFFKYFSFLFTNWGKASFYLFMSVNSFRQNWAGYTAFALFVALSVFYFVIFILKPEQRVPLPIAQQGGVSFSTSSADFN